MIFKIRIDKTFKNIYWSFRYKDTKCELREILEPKKHNRRVIEDVTI